MKQQTVQNDFAMLHQLESIEKNLEDLKLSILKKLTPTGKKKISFRGILKGVDISEEDIDAAKKSICSKVKIYSFLLEK